MMPQRGRGSARSSAVATTPFPSNLLEVVMLTLAADRVLVIHAMPLRRAYYGLLPEGGDADA